MKNKYFRPNQLLVILLGGVRTIEDFSLLTLSINENTDKFEIFTDKESLFVGDFINNDEKQGALNFLKALEQRNTELEKVNQLFKLASDNCLYFIGKKHLEFGNPNIFQTQFMKANDENKIINLDEIISSIVETFEINEEKQEEEESPF